MGKLLGAETLRLLRQQALRKNAKALRPIIPSAKDSAAMLQGFHQKLEEKAGSLMLRWKAQGSSAPDAPIVAASTAAEANSTLTSAVLPPPAVQLLSRLLGTQRASALVAAVDDINLPLADVKALQAATALGYLFAHPDRLRDVNERPFEQCETSAESAGVKAEAELPFDTAHWARVAAAAYATSERPFLRALGPPFASSDILHAQYASKDLLPAHMLLRDRIHNVLVFTVRGTAALTDILADVTASVVDATTGELLPLTTNASQSTPEVETGHDASSGHRGPAGAAESVAESREQTLHFGAHAGIAACAESFMSQALSDAIGPDAIASAVSQCNPSAAVDDAALKTAAQSALQACYDRGVYGIAAVVEAIRAACPEVRDWPLLFVGHSLGAAISAVLTARVRIMLQSSAEQADGKNALSSDGATSIAAEPPQPAQGNPLRLLSSSSSWPVYAIIFASPPCLTSHAAALTRLTPVQLASLQWGYQADESEGKPPAHINPALPLPSPPPLSSPFSSDASSLANPWLHRPIVTSFLLGDDVIPRTTLRSVRQLYDVLSDPQLTAEASSTALAELKAAGERLKSSVDGAIGTKLKEAQAWLESSFPQLQQQLAVMRTQEQSKAGDASSFQLPPLGRVPQLQNLLQLGAPSLPSLALPKELLQLPPPPSPDAVKEAVSVLLQQLGDRLKGVRVAAAAGATVTGSGHLEETGAQSITSAIPSSEG